MGRLALIAFMIVAVFFGVRSLTGRSDVVSADVDATAAETELVTVISKGQAVAIKDYVPDKGIVIVEFMADW